MLIAFDVLRLIGVDMLALNAAPLVVSQYSGIPVRYVPVHRLPKATTPALHHEIP
jgi:hypothetical protein